MDISSELSAIQSRIAQITGAQDDGVGMVAPSSRGVDGLAQFGPGGLPPEAAGRFADLVQAALARAQSDGFATPGQDAGGRAPSGAYILPPERVDALVQQNAQAWGVDPALVKAVIANESGFNANATSPVGAQGLMQLMPETAKSLGVSDSYDPAQNVAGGTRYLRGLLDRFNGDVKRAVAAYNAGPGAVEKYDGVPPYRETQNYVSAVLDSYGKYKAPAQQANAAP